MLIAYHGMARGSLDPTCGDRFTVSRALLCKGDFVAQRHDGIQSILTSLLSKVCNDVDVKPHLLPIDSDVLNPRSTVTSPEVRLDIKAGSFWSRGETAFFDVCRTYVNSTCNQNKSTESIFLEYEKDKKRNYQQRVIEVEMGFPPPLLFWHERKKGEGMQAFSKQPSGQTPPPLRKTASRMPVPYLVLEQAPLLKFLRSICSLRGSRSPFHKDAEFLDDFSVNARIADIFN